MPARLLVTRPLDSAQDFAQAARAAGWRGSVVIAPLMAIVPVPVPPGALDNVGSVIATSQHALVAMARMRRDLPVWCVGPRTFQAASEAGFTHLHQGPGDGAALVADVLAAPPPQPILHLHGAAVALDIALLLRDAGLQARDLVVYDQTATALTAPGRACLTQAGDVVIPVFSPRTARLLAQEVAQIGHLAANLHLLALSPAVATALAPVPRVGLRVAEQPQGGALLTMLLAMQAELEASANPR